MSKVLEKIGIVTYRLELLDHMRAHHLVFYISQLKPCRIDEGDLSRDAPSKAIALSAYKLELEVDKIYLHIGLPT